MTTDVNDKKSAGKVSRREFIKDAGILIGGAAIGAGITYPLVPKGGTEAPGPVTPEVRENGRWLHGSCALCLSCPTQYYVQDGVITDAKWENLPNYEAKACPGSMAAVLGRTYAPDRILHPLKRVGERGEGKFERCTWDEITDVVANTIKKYQAESEYGDARAFENWWGCPIQTDDQYQMSYWAKKTKTAISYMHGQVCWGLHRMTSTCIGSPTMSPDVMDPDNNKFIISGTQNIPGTKKSGGGYEKFRRAKTNGCHFVVLDPFHHDTASLSDEWIPIKPGTDAAFALGIAKYLLDRGMHQEDFLKKYTNAGQLIKASDTSPMLNASGEYMVWQESTNSPQAFPDFGVGDIDLGLKKTFTVDGVECITALQAFYESASQWTPQRVVDYCEIPYPASKIEELAQKLGENAPAVMFAISGFTEKCSNDTQKYLAGDCVDMLLGDFKAKGGWASVRTPGFGVGDGWPEETGKVPSPGFGKFIPMGKDYDEDLIPWDPEKHIQSSGYLGCPEDAIPVMAGKFHPNICALPWYHIDAIAQGKVKALWSTCENTAYTGTNAKRIYEVCRDHLELLIVDEQSPKDFTDLADYVLPAASMHERRIIYSGSQHKNGRSVGYVYARSPVIKPCGEAKSMPWFMMEVAKKLGIEVDMEDTCSTTGPYSWSDRRLKTAGILGKTSVERLRTEGPYTRESASAYSGPSKLGTPTGRYEMYPNTFAVHYFNSPWWKGHEIINPVARQIDIAQPQADDEFYLIQGKESWHQKNATQNNRYLMESVINGYYEPTALFINKARADKLGLRTGDWVELERIGPTKAQGRGEIKDDNLGAKSTSRVKVTEIVHPSSLFGYDGGGHRAPSMIKPAQEGISGNWLSSDTIVALSGGMAKGEVIVKLRRL